MALLLTNVAGTSEWTNNTLAGAVCLDVADLTAVKAPTHWLWWLWAVRLQAIISAAAEAATSWLVRALVLHVAVPKVRSDLTSDLNDRCRDNLLLSSTAKAAISWLVWTLLLHVPIFELVSTSLKPHTAVVTTYSSEPQTKQPPVGLPPVSPP